MSNDKFGSGGLLLVALLSFGASRCSICREVLVQGEPIVATTHFIGDPADPFWRFSDTSMHAACFEKWEHRAEFAARYYAVMGRKLTSYVPAVTARPDAPPLLKGSLAVLGTTEARAEYLASLGRSGGQVATSDADEH